MITRHTIEIHCDHPGCVRLIVVEATSDRQARDMAWTCDWNAGPGRKDLCPQHSGGAGL